MYSLRVLPRRHDKVQDNTPSILLVLIVTLRRGIEDKEEVDTIDPTYY